MSATAQLGMPAPPSVWHMYRAMVGVGLLCGLIIVSVYELTRPVIEHNKAEALKRAIFQVLPGARSSATFRFDAQERFERLAEPVEGAEQVYAGYDAERKLVGVAVEAQGMGYQDVIHVLYGYDFDQDAIVGIRVLESRETPGLGDKIESDPDFLANFERLAVALTSDLTALANPIAFVKNGQKQHPWQIDGITGATISSRAIANILSGSTAQWIPRIRRNLDDFRRVE